MGDNPFYLQKDEQLPEKVLLVDDIYTTGATLYDAITVLRKNGIKMIKTFSLAR
ncbi:ComF family protein [Streptococcus sp. zg-JUN1979]|uniref:ComF family protein n=1 Tax=Streptococcus sp. zg-JUN1979 TaxID=3391450 RepID=UPI0039A44806